MKRKIQLAVIAAAIAVPAQSATIGLDYTLTVNATQQYLDGALQPLVQLPADEHRIYSGRLDIGFGGSSETLMPTGNPGQQLRIQSIAVSFNFYQLAPDLLPFAAAPGLPAPISSTDGRLELARTETGGVADDGGAYMLRDLAWTSNFGSAAFDLATLTSRRVDRYERIFIAPAFNSFRFASIDAADIAAGLEAAQYRGCGNVSCAASGTLGWVVFNGDESFVVGSGQRTGEGGLFVGGLTFAQAVTPVPEPAAWAMMIAGFGIAGAALRRRERVDFAAA